MAGVCDFANHGEIKFPFVKDRLGKFLASGLQHHQHAFLAFGQHHFIRRHAFFAARHLVHVQNDACLAIGRHFDA